MSELIKRVGQPGWNVERATKKAMEHLNWLDLYWERSEGDSYSTRFLLANYLQWQAQPGYIIDRIGEFYGTAECFVFINKLKQWKRGYTDEK